MTVTSSGAQRSRAGETFPLLPAGRRASWRKCHLGTCSRPGRGGEVSPTESTAEVPAWSACGAQRRVHPHFLGTERVFRSARTLDVLQSKVTLKAGVQMRNVQAGVAWLYQRAASSGHLAVHAGPSLEATWCPREGWDLKCGAVRSPILPAVWPWAGLPSSEPS